MKTYQDFKENDDNNNSTTTTEQLTLWMESLSGDDSASLQVSISHTPVTIANAIQWARGTFEKHFYRDILQLIEQHPQDELDEDGKPFWSG